MKVKNILLCGVVFLVIANIKVKAQDQDMETLNNFKYAVVETLFYENMEVDKYSISGNVRKHFLDKGYRVVTETKKYWPDELFKNPCMALYCTINATSAMFAKYKVQIEMKDCNGNVVYAATGKGIGDTEVEAYKNATDDALYKFDSWNYHYMPGKTIKLKKQLVAKKIEGLYDAISGITGLKIEIKEANARLEAHVIHSTDKKIKIGTLLATFERNSLSKDLYNVDWMPESKNAYETLASLDEEAGRLTIELKEKDQTKQLVFRKIE